MAPSWRFSLCLKTFSLLSQSHRRNADVAECLHCTSRSPPRKGDIYVVTRKYAAERTASSPESA